MGRQGSPPGQHGRRLLQPGQTEQVQRRNVQLQLLAGQHAVLRAVLQQQVRRLGLAQVDRCNRVVVCVLVLFAGLASIAGGDGVVFASTLFQRRQTGGVRKGRLLATSHTEI